MALYGSETQTVFMKYDVYVKHLKKRSAEWKRNRLTRLCVSTNAFKTPLSKIWWRVKKCSMAALTKLDRIASLLGYSCI